jgi:hypothetical protein
MSRILISAAVILLIAAMILVARPKFQNGGQDKSITSDPATNPATDSNASPRDSSIPLRTKSRNRVIHRTPMMDETMDLLNSTIIPLLKLEDQNVGEMANQIRLHIQDAGIEPHELRIICAMPAPNLKNKVRDLGIRNIPLNSALKIICDSTKLRHHVCPGVVEFYFYPDFPHSIEPERSNLQEKPYPTEEVDVIVGPDPYADPEPGTPMLDTSDPYHGIE